MDNYLEIKSRTSQDQKVLNSLILLFYYLIFTSLNLYLLLQCQCTPAQKNWKM